MSGDGEQKGPGRSSLRPPVLLLMAAVVVAIGLLVLEPLGPRGPDPNPEIIGSGRQLVVGLEPDSVRVGEPFVLGVTMREEEPGEITFPPVLTLDDRLEQTGPADIRVSEDGREWRVYYTLVGWRAEQIDIPTFGVMRREAGAESSREVLVRPPAVEVLSVLPLDEEELELREARPYLRISRPPWAWLLLGLLALLPLWLWWRRRTTLAAAGAYLSPGERALHALAELRAQWKRNELTGAQLFDGVEGTLRDFVAATRQWLPSRSLDDLGREDETLGRALARSALVRFARLRTSLETSLGAIDAAVGFVKHEIVYRAEHTRAGSEQDADPGDSEVAEGEEPGRGPDPVEPEVER